MSTPNRKAIYTGRRQFGTGKTAQEFLLLPERKAIYFRGIQGVAIGYTYACAENSMPKRPSRTTDGYQDNPDWEAKDALAEAAMAEKRAEEKIIKQSRPAIDRAVEALRPLMKGANYYQRKQLIELLCEKAYK